MTKYQLYRQTVSLSCYGIVASLYLLLMFSPQVADASSWPKKKYRINYIVTSKMWDAEQKKAVRTSKQVLDDIHYAFNLWEQASDETLQFSFGGFGKEGYDGYNQIPYDGDIYVVLNGRYKDHGEMANARFSGSIPGDYKKGVIFVAKKPGTTHRNILAHEIGHVLGLGHAASSASIMFSGMWANNGAMYQQVSEQDALDLRHLWEPDSKKIFTMSGTIETKHSHKMALVFAVNAKNGHTYSARSDLKGKFKVVIGEPGYYKLAAKSVEVSDDLKILKREGYIPQSASWYVEHGVSTDDPDKAWRILVFRDRAHTEGAVMKLIDRSAPFRLTKSFAASENGGLDYLRPGDDVMLSFPEVSNFLSIDAFGSEPDYEFTTVPVNYRSSYQARLKIKNDAIPGERLVVVRDANGRSHIGLVGIHITQQQPRRFIAGEKTLIADLNFDSDMNDHGPFGMKAEMHGDEVSLVRGIKGQGLFIGGTEDWLDIPLPDELLLESGFTSEFWFKREDWENPYKGGSGFQTLAAVTSSFSQDLTAKGCALTDPWALVASVSHTNRKHNESETVRAYTKPDTVKPGKWYHAASVYNPYEQSLTLYINGKVVETGWAVPAPRFSYRNLRLGTWYKANQAFRGTFDEFRLYNYPKTAEDIRQAASL